jgi:hypothetical protein
MTVKEAGLELTGAISGSDTTLAFGLEVVRTHAY